jgi:hypothetical protein
MQDSTIEQEWWRDENLDLRGMIQELIMHEIDVITESDWFNELVETAVKKIINDVDNGFDIAYNSK